MQRSIIFITAALLLSSCMGSQNAATPTADAQSVLNAVKQTVNANLTSTAASIPTATLAPTLTPTILASTEAPQTPTLTLTPALTATKATLADKAELVSQSVPDQSKFNPGAPFSVTWTFKNVGTTTWSTNYSAKFWSDELMGSPDTIRFSKEVKSNETIDITLNFKAPANIGSVKSSWWLQNQDGVNFFPFFIALEVVSALPTPPTPTVTETIAITPTETVTGTP